ncbi:hypothetical protein ACFO1V_10590 [Daeguia caeni]|uniref:Uncharacterized protein n=1 Tax=Daeguia caeni TaxID=439612 RepID=A0ABV9H9M8_9HYPH
MRGTFQQADMRPDGTECVCAWGGIEPVGCFLRQFLPIWPP